MNPLTRRQLLRLASGGLALAATGPAQRTLALPQPGGPPAAVQANLHTASVQTALQDPVLQNGDGFTTVFVAWNGPADAAPEAELRVRGPAGAWSAWQPLHQDHHVPVSSDGPLHFYPVFQVGLDYELRTANPADLTHFETSTLNSASNSSLLGVPEEDEEDEPIELIDGFIIPRAGWGANEDYRHDGQDPDNPIGWPPRYSTIERVVVHHTATEIGWDDPAAVVRSVYFYHAVILDWTDIGYNFLIDVYGNVYEGRYGGPGVVGGHALEYNRGSIGIAFVGSFSGASPSQAAQDSLVRLIRTRAPDVDPAIAADWLDWGDVPNICGHGDVMATDCPGSDLQSALPTVRGQLAGSTPVYFPAPVRLYDPKIVNFEVGPTLVDPEGLIEVRATISQDGREPLISQGPDPGFVYDEREDFDTAGYSKVEGRFRLAVDLVGADGVSNPYRWGFGEAIQSGDKREIVGYIRAADLGAKRLVPSIVREFVRYYEDEELYESVFVVHPRVARVAETREVGGHYFQETGHNVPASFYEYWESHGGLNRFGFPLTEAYEERSETDGGRYLTQYFERARFEYHPELEYKNDAVKLGLLGFEQTVQRYEDEPFLPIKALESTDEVWYFPETGHSTSFRFLEYWIANGGVETFGYPISEKFDEYSDTDGKVHLVQYFERARFEYHPDDSWDKQVKLGHLGREILIGRGWLPGPRDIS